LLGTWDKAEQYLKKIGTTILVGSLIIWALGYFPVHNIYGEKRSSTVKPAQTELSSAVNDNSEQEFNQDSYLTSIGKFIQPVMKPLGFDWKMSVALLSGIAAKEIVVSTMGIIYMPPGNAGNLSLQEALRTELRPDGSHMFNTAVCLSLLLFVLIYIPCIATIATIKHETGKWRWALFAVAYTVLLAWIVSFLVYNCVRLGIYQQVIVGFLILMALYLSIKKIRKTFGKKNKCDSICEECRFSGECKLKELKKK
jgi:ferrous iron transport protein B